VQVGNPELDTEKSNTLTVGMVLSPGGWAQGMRLSVDYFTISVTDAIATSFRSGNPILACWEESGNSNAEYFDDGEIDPNYPGMNGLIDQSLASCRDITFGQNEDGSINLQDVVSYNSSRPENSLPIKRRGIDVALSYMFPLNRVFETLPGTVSLTVRGTRALEASGIQVISFSDITRQQPGYSLTNPPERNFCNVRGGTLELGEERTGGLQGGNCFIPVDMVGQIRTSVFIPGVSASPKWTGNIITSYQLGDLSTSLSARYIGGAVMDKSWTDDPDSPLYMNELGQYLNGSIDNNWVKPYFNFSLNGTYNLDIGNMKQFQVFGSVNNLFDKSPPFTGGGISGASSGYHDIMGRAYRMGVRMRF
jgi:outer membrane receptor protein involved in Fe transport